MSRRLGALRRLRQQGGLALMGSLLLVSMLAVLSTAFLLIMAADVRTGMSHMRNTQAFYIAESAASIANYKMSAVPSYTGGTIVAGTDTFQVTISTPDASYPYYRQLYVIGMSGKASYDLYDEVLMPDQDPRTYFPIFARDFLELRADCRVVGGYGIWWADGEGNPANCRMADAFDLDSPTGATKWLWAAGSVWWNNSYVHTDWYSTASFTLRTGVPEFTTEFPQILLTESWPYSYKVTNDNTTYRATALAQNVNGGTYGPTGSFGTAGANPMGIYVWRFASGTFSGNITINGTLVCTQENGDLTIQDGNFTINPRTLAIPGPDEYYPAIIGRGQIQIRTWGTRTINGMVYVSDIFHAHPVGGTVAVNGAVYCERALIHDDTTIIYDSRLDTQPSAPFKGDFYPTVLLHRRRYVYSWWIF